MKNNESLKWKFRHYLVYTIKYQPLIYKSLLDDSVIETYEHMYSILTNDQKQYRNNVRKIILKLASEKTLYKLILANKSMSSAAAEKIKNKKNLRKIATNNKIKKQIRFYAYKNLKQQNEKIPNREFWIIAEKSIFSLLNTKNLTWQEYHEAKHILSYITKPSEQITDKLNQAEKYLDEIDRNREFPDWDRIAENLRAGDSWSKVDK